MIKPLGASVLIKIIKKKSSISLLPGTNVAAAESEAIVQEIGTRCSLGVMVGHAVMFKHGLQPVVVEENDDYDLLIVPEVSILYIKNWVDKDDDNDEAEKGK